MNSIQDEWQIVPETDQKLEREIAKLLQGEAWVVDFASEVRRLTDAHILKTRNHFRVVLIGGADGQKNDASLHDTILALEETDLLVQLYLGHSAQVAQAVNRVIPTVPSLKQRQLVVPELAA